MIQIIAAAIVSVVIIMLVKQYKPEYAVVLEVAAGIVIFFMILKDIPQVISGIEFLTASAGYNREYAEILMKALGICILTQLGSDTCRDAGEGALATKVELAGKVTVIALSMPLFQAVSKIITSIIGG